MRCSSRARTCGSSAVARRAAADHAVRRHRRDVVRVRARLRPHALAPGRARSVLGRGAARGAARGRPVVLDRGGQPGPRRSCASPGSTAARSSWARPPRSRSSCSCSRSCVGAAVVVLYGVTVRGVVVLAVRGGGRDHRTGGHRYGLRRAGRRIARARDARAAARPPRRHPGDARRDPLVPGRARRHAGRRVAVGAAARRVRGAWRSRPAPSRSVRCWRKHEATLPRRDARRRARRHGGLRAVGHAAARRPGLRRGPAALPARADRVGRVSRVRRHRAGVVAVARPAHPRHRVGPARRRVGGGRRRVHRPHAHRSVRSGASPRGAPGGSGTRGSPPPRSSSSSTSATSRCGARVQPPTSGASAARSRR